MTMPKTTMRTPTVEDTTVTRDAEVWLDRLDPTAVPAEDPDDLRRIGLAQRDIETAETELHKAVAASRAAGRSWAQIGMVLGVTRQSAQERFGRGQAITN